MNRWAWALAVWLVGASCTSERVPPQARDTSSATPSLVVPVAFRVPSDSEVTDPELLRSLRRGRALLRNTRDSLPAHVGNRLQCVSCHVKDGTQKNALSLVGVYSRFPQYRSRTGTVGTIEDRVNDCFERSLNGRALDRTSPEMRDFVTYMAFLSRGVPAGATVDGGQGTPAIEPPLVGDTARGAKMYATTCAACHGVDGQGTNAAPPVWGPHSFNVGASMARVRTAAAFIRAAMPQTLPGSLTPQQAFDLASYINSHTRPDFARKSLDWPRGDPPPDVPYQTRGKSGL
jgi:thiosulfate dehydrogenase